MTITDNEGESNMINEMKMLINDLEKNEDEINNSVKIKSKNRDNRYSRKYSRREFINLRKDWIETTNNKIKDETNSKRDEFERLNSKIS
ncbi:7765_t:CDS:2, partial [Racocetra persica]